MNTKSQRRRTCAQAKGGLDSSIVCYAAGHTVVPRAVPRMALCNHIATATADRVVDQPRSTAKRFTWVQVHLLARSPLSTQTHFVPSAFGRTFCIVSSTSLPISLRTAHILRLSIVALPSCVPGRTQAELWSAGACKKTPMARPSRFTVRSMEEVVQSR